MHVRVKVCAVVLLAACTSSSDRAAAQLKALEAQHAKEKAEKAKAEAQPKTAAPSIALPAPYGDADSTVIQPDGACPEGLWAFFNGAAPGATPDEKKANAAKRAQWVTDLKAKQFMVKLRVPLVSLSAFDAPSGKFTISVPGTIDCTDEAGHIAIAWSDAKAGAGTPSAAKEGAELTQNIWSAEPLTFALPMAMADVKPFELKNKLGLSARVVFTLVKGDVDVKKVKMGKVEEKAQGQTIGYGGGMEDWGAGRLIRAHLVAVRVASDQEKNQLFEQKP